MNPAIFSAFLLFLLPLYCLLTRRRRSKRLPPGSLGLPIIGHSLIFLNAMRKNTAENWLQERTRKYGPVSKLSLFGTQTLFLHGQAANKFIYTCDADTLSSQQNLSVRRICGERNIFELTGCEHKRVRGALASFLKPEVLKQYAGSMDEQIRNHFNKHWYGKKKVSAMPLMKTLTFDLMNELIIGMEQGTKRAMLIKLFEQLMEGLVSVPINLPFTRYNRSLQASATIREIIMDLILEKRAALEHQKASPQQDLITRLLSLRTDDNSVALSEEEIIDNIIIIMIAGHDTSSILLTVFIRDLSSNPAVYASVVQEQEEIAKSKASDGLLTWDDLAKMKYTWRVAMESLRMSPPAFCSFRKVVKDFEYEGYRIPKGWQVMWAACMTHMDEFIFPNPSEFDPKRFENQASVPPYSYVPFGAGPRICPGNEFARIETLVTIHYLVNNFTWKLCSTDSSVTRDPTLGFRDGLQIEIEPKMPVKAN